MILTYKHGIYGQQVPTADVLPPAGVGTLPVYIGTAPVQQVVNPTAAVNVPLLLNSYEDAVAKIGYSENWETFTLCEAVYAHFKNRLQPIGPIIVINVMDPAKHKTPATATVSITNNVGYLLAPAVLDTIVITGKVQGEDYTAEYTPDGRVKLTALSAGSLAASTSVSYDVMDRAKIKAEDIIGGQINGIRTGVAVVDLVYQTLNLIPTVLAAPGWSQVKAVKEALVARAQQINGHWDAVVLADLDAGSQTNTIAKAIAWKEANGYTDVSLKVGWPKVSSAGRHFWSSTVMGVALQQTDFNNDNVPFVSPSNKQVDISGTQLAEGVSLSFDEMQANELNANGITTFVFRGGVWVLWGPHHANYVYGTDVDPKNIFDASIRMMRYLTNSFQHRYAAVLDGPLNRSVVDTVLNDAGVWMNSLIADGKLLHGNIGFAETSNPTSSLITGDFVFDIQTTTTPVAKALTFKVQYTTQGLSVLFGGEN